VNINPQKHIVIFVAALATLLLSLPATARDEQRPELLVFAAASLTNVLEELSAAWKTHSSVPVKLAFAASSTLARQIEAGGGADVFVSADQEWMDYLQQRGLIQASTRTDLVGNRLVLIEPADGKSQLKITPGFRLAEALGGGRLSTGDPETVPVGRYARSALRSLGVWGEIQDRLVRADNVRNAMMFVVRGEAPLGIVYTTDALAEPKVRIIDTFPANTHAPINYPGAVTRSARGEATAFLSYLASPEASDTWKKFGFLELTK
jgi:molybdate transport system substrate-binding protein